MCHQVRTRALLRLRSKWYQLVNLWESAQVELHGSYSIERVLELAKYESKPNCSRDIAILVGIPLPCFLATVVIDALPLGNPAEGIEANSMSFVRVYYSFVILSLVATYLVRTIMPSQPNTVTRAVLNSFVVSAITVGILYGVTRAIGFPLPFSILTVSPAWVILLSIFVVAAWAKQIRNSPETRQSFIDLIILWIRAKGIRLLLPVIKLIMRNLFARVTVRLSDATPEFVVFHAEVFNSLFMSYCMQKAPSIWTSLQITSVDVAFTLVSLRDIESARLGLRNLERRIDKKNGWGRFRSSAQNGKYLERTTLDRASELLKQDENQESARVSSIVDILHIASYREMNPKKVKSQGSKLAIWTTAVMPKKEEIPSVVVQHVGGVVHPTDNSDDLSENVSSNISITLRYTCKVRRLLYMAEFLVLLNYVKVFIPLIFSMNMLATYHLPNRDYYATFDGMDHHELMQTLQNVMFYCLLQLFSLAVLVFTLRRMLGLSPTRQLAFVLEKQFHRVHSAVVFWVFYNVQASLVHSGYDYSFKFAWLNTETGTKNV